MISNDAKDPGWMVSIILYTGDQGGLRVWSVEMLFNGVKHRMTFSRSNGINEIFGTRLSEQFAAICERLADAESSFLVMPDLEVSRGPVKLVGLRGMRTEARNGRRQLNLRFKYFIGQIQDLLHVKVPFDRHVADHKERIAVEALSDITSPLLGIASLHGNHVLSQAQEVSLEAKLERVSDRASDLQFYLSLLMRYVRECSETVTALQNEADDDVLSLAPVNELSAKLKVLSNIEQKMDDVSQIWIIRKKVNFVNQIFTGLP